MGLACYTTPISVLFLMVGGWWVGVLLDNWMGVWFGAWVGGWVVWWLGGWASLDFSKYCERIARKKQQLIMLPAHE